MPELAYAMVTAPHDATKASIATHIRVAVVDDCALFREGIRRALAESGNIEIVDQASSIGEAMRITYDKRPDIIVLSGTAAEPEIDAIPAFRAVHPNAKIVIIGGKTDERRVKAALLAGARAYLSKKVTSSELVETIRAIHADRTMVSLGAAPERDAAAVLTPREQQILDKIARGQSNKEIAQALRIAEKTVKQHITRIFEKLDVHNRVEAALRASPGPLRRN